MWYRPAPLKEYEEIGVSWVENKKMVILAIFLLKKYLSLAKISQILSNTSWQRRENMLHCSVVYKNVERFLKTSHKRQAESERHSKPPGVPGDKYSHGDKVTAKVAKELGLQIAKVE